jgi:hypothetical protein
MKFPNVDLSFDEVALGVRLVRGLPAFLRQPLDLDLAHGLLRQRLARRGEDFLSLVRQGIYASAASPYRQLLAEAGCELGDLRRLVAQDGVEGALQTLLRGGVYLTVDELKGRRPVVRGSTTITVDPSQVRNPIRGARVPTQSSGSGGAASLVPINLAYLRDRAVSSGLALAARGGWPSAVWQHALWGVPGGAAIVRLLEFSALGAPPVRWFSQVDPAGPGLHPRYRWSARGIRWAGRLAGLALPAPRFVSIDNPLPVARWMVEVLRAGGTPHLHTYASSAVLVCSAAIEAGLDLRGAQFTMSSEPITAARLAAVQESGAAAGTCYASIECGPIGYGCLEPTAADDLHVLQDLHALIQPAPDEQQTGLPAGALLISSLRATAPLILLNVSLGDQAQIATRRCGCALEQLGWTTHLQSIRSYEKLTAGGMAFLDTDVIRVLEESLPRRFGGGPVDYQLLEEHDERGQPRLRLLVHPALGPLDDDAVVDFFLAAIGTPSAEQVMERQWRQAGWLRVERRAPLTTESGKILHLHRARPRPAATVGSSTPD